MALGPTAFRTYMKFVDADGDGKADKENKLLALLNTAIRTEW